MKPFLGQDKACATLKASPQTQWVGKFRGSKPYLSATASLNAPLCNANPCVLTGLAVSQVDTLGSWASSTAHYKDLGNSRYSSSACSRCSFILVLLISACAVFWSAKAFKRSVGSFRQCCVSMSLTNGAVTFRYLWCSLEDIRTGCPIPSPPCLAGIPKNARIL